VCGSAADPVAPTIAQPETAGAARLPAPAAPRLRVEAMTIQWPGADAPLVTGLSFEVAPGRIVVLVGPSGSGKTSVLRALLGLAPVTAGGWRLDGPDRVPLADANERGGGRKLAALAA